jgi:hypothetical protein
MYPIRPALCSFCSFGLSAALLPALSGCSAPAESPKGATDEQTDDSDTTDDSGTPNEPNTASLLEEFYAQNGGREAFDGLPAAALEALLHGEDDVDAGDLASAAARVQAVFATWPYESDDWYSGAPAGLNIGSPVSYYGLRMLEHVVDAGPVEVTHTIQMTAIVATCATVTRPTLPDLEPETVSLELDPEILANDARVLRESTNLFRHWVTAITRGVGVELVVVEMEGCATVTYTDDGSIIVSYPDTGEMIAGIPTSTARDADFLWVVAPSGVPGDGSGYGRHFITGGMGGAGARPLFLSDDAWFIRKPEHLGTGDYHTVERRAYQPQWFQHEFMHHVFRTWPELQLEVSAHQWFDRSTWPADFEGRFEPDYYSEAINKRLFDVTPTMAEGFTGKDYADMATTPLSALAGTYQRQPMENDWHLVTVTVEGESATWTNAAGVAWSLVVDGGTLYSGSECPYGAVAIDVELDSAGAVSALWFGGEAYVRQ